jgi:hypothetical protein
MEAIGARGAMGERNPPFASLARAMRGALAGLVAVAAIVAAVGLLYEIRSVSALSAGPDVRGALPLQQLAGGEAQPLLRMAIAWVPAGFIAGLALTRITKLRPLTRGVLLGVAAAFLLFVAGAAADAIAISDPLGPHLMPQLARPATWVAVGLFLGGSLVP